MKTPKNQGKSWTNEDLKQLKSLAKQNTPTRLIAYKMGRSEGSIYSAASNNSVSLKPANQSPYNRRKK